MFSNVHESVLKFWNDNNLTEKDFYCRDCGKLLIDLPTVENIEYVNSKKPFFKIRGKSSRYDKFVEPAEQRWCISGRNLSGKIFFRKICWDCFFTKLKQTEDIAKKARKSTWYKKILNGADEPPPSWTSPSAYFKLLFDITDDELNAERTKFDTASKESWIRRHGEVEGLKKYEEYCARQRYTCSKEYMITKKGLSEDEWNQYNASRASTKENFIKRYGKKAGLQKWKDYCKHEAYAGCKLEYFIEKYGEDEGRTQYLEVCSKKVSTIENFIKRYGPVEGKIKFEAAQNKSYSKVSQILFNKIDNLLGEFATNSNYALKNFEKRLDINTKDHCKIYYLDYCLNNKVIEFNGDYWHANPAFYKADEKINTQYKQLLVNDIWEADNQRLKLIQDAGYQVLVIWEKDYYENPDEVLQKCIAFLKN